LKNPVQVESAKLGHATRKSTTTKATDAAELTQNDVNLLEHILAKMKALVKESGK